MRRIILIQISLIVILVTFDELQASTVIDDDDVLKDTNLKNNFNSTLMKKINDILETKLKDVFDELKEDQYAKLKDEYAKVKDEYDKLKEDQYAKLKDEYAKVKDEYDKQKEDQYSKLKDELKENQYAMLKDLHAKREQEIKCSLWHLKLDQFIGMLDECCEFFVKNNRPKSRWAAVLPSTLPYDAHFNPKRVPAEVEEIIDTLIAVRHRRSHALQKNAGAIEELLKSLETYLNDAIDCNQSDKLERYLPGSIDFITKCLKPENVTSPQHNRKQRLNKKMKRNKRKMQKIPLSFDCQPDGKTTHRQKKNRYLIHLVCNFDVHDVNEFFDRF